MFQPCWSRGHSLWSFGAVDTAVETTAFGAVDTAVETTACGAVDIAFGALAQWNAELCGLGGNRMVL